MHKITLHAKDAMGTIVVNGKIVGVVAASAIMSQKFLDLKEIVGKFTTVEAGSTMEKVLDHQGAIKVGAGMLTLHLTRNTKIGKSDLFKWAMIGVMLQGAVQEVNQLSSGKAGQIGAGDSEINKEMEKAAQEISKNMNGEGDQKYIGADNPTTEYPTSVAGAENPTTQYPTSVAGGALEDGTGVAGEEEEDYNFLHGEEDYI